MQQDKFFELRKCFFDNHEVRQRISYLQKSATTDERAGALATMIGALCYFGSVYLGSSGFGWTLFVIAVASSFYMVFMHILVYQQRTLAEILERGINLAKDIDSINQERIERIEKS